MCKTAKIISLAILCSLFNQVLPAQKVLRPFPQHVNYNPGLIKPGHVSQQQMDDSVSSFYNAWKERYLNDDAGEGQYYIWVEGSVRNNKCVSEAQGYGMIIV